MQLEVILPLVAYLLVVFGLSVYAMRKRVTGTFLNEYFLGSRSMGGVVLGRVRISTLRNENETFSQLNSITYIGVFLRLVTYSHLP